LKLERDAGYFTPLLSAKFQHDVLCWKPVIFVMLEKFLELAEKIHILMFYITAIG